MNRTKILATATVILLLAVLVHHLWAGWGLITIHAKGEPLGKVVASMQRQGHAVIQTDLAGDTPVTMDVVQVTLPDALETLSAATDSRWRLLYFVAGDKATLKAGESAWFWGRKPDGWKLVSFPVGNLISLGEDEDPPVLDPRQDIWNPKAAAPAPVQAFFAEAAQATSAGFAFPSDWNPTVTKTPPSGLLRKVVPKMLGTVRGHSDELFFLTKNVRRTAQNTAGGSGQDFRLDPDLLAARVQDELRRLPPEQRAEAQSNFAAEQAFRASLRDLTDEQRQAAWQQHMQDPVVQQQMANRMDARDARMNHEQRMQSFSNYVNRKLAARGKL